MPDIQALEHKLETFRDEIGGRFDRVHDDLKELTKALRDLIRLDGDIRRLQDAMSRIGHESGDHELRLRELEGANATAAVEHRHLDRTQWLGITTVSTIISAIVVGVIVFVVTH